MYYQSIGFMLKAIEDNSIDNDFTSNGKYVDKEEYAYTSFSKAKVFEYYADAILNKTECEKVVVVGKTIAGKWRIMRKGVGC